MEPRGVVTASDATYFPGLLALHASIQTSWPCPVACYDVGLTPEQRLAADRLSGLTILDLPDDPVIAALEQAIRNSTAPAKPGKRIWPIWICPILIRAAPFIDVFWIDSDILVLRGLDELFDRLDDGPVFTPENKAPELAPNSSRLYELLPIERAFDPRLPLVNGGVSGWRKSRDQAALDAYIRPVAAAAWDPHLMQFIAWQDQGALIWAIQSLGLEDRVLESSLWNLCADHIDLPAEMLRWDDGLCDRLRRALPEVRLLHWNGRPMPWRA